jgi:uncharacterized protein (DUF302 family)
MALKSVESPYSVSATVGRLTAAIMRRRITIFARIDHAANARAVGLEMPDEQVLVFGDPRAGTPLMRSDPRVGFELPLRLVVWTEDGMTRIGYEPPVTLAARYDVGARDDVLRAMGDLLAELVTEATMRSAA